MCAAALKWAQVDRLVFAARDPKEGFSQMKDRILPKKLVVASGILEEQASTLLKQFFLLRRDQKN
jgi:tRNA(adenine34) deaminase